MSPASPEVLDWPSQKLDESGSYATLEDGVVSVRRKDGRVVLQMARETWDKLGMKDFDVSR